MLAVGALSSEPPQSAERLREEPKSEGEESRQWPRFALPIPSSFWNAIEEDLRLFLFEELSVCEAERGRLISNFARWMEAYLAPMAEGPKNFPIHNSSNITLALIKEHVHTIGAQLVQSTMTARPWWVFKDLAKEWEQFIDEIEFFMDIAGERDLHLEKRGVEWILESAILGTSIMEVPYEVDSRNVYRTTADGRGVYPKEVIFHDGPICKHVPLATFWIRLHERDIQKARWCAKRFLYSEVELREKETQGKFFGVDKLLDFYQDPTALDDKVTQKADEILNQKPIRPDRFEIFEIYCSFDVDSDKRFEELHLFFHRDSGVFIGRNFLPYWNGKRPFVKLGYFPRADRFYDEGLAELLEQLQVAVSAIVNRRADNATLANLKMIIKRKIMKNLQPGDPLYSGKIIEANDIWNDVREFSMSEIYPSTINEEQLLRSTAERLSGVNEAAMGAAMPVTRTTAAAQLALLQEQRNRMGLTVSNIRQGFKEIGGLAMDHYFQFGTMGKAVAWMGDRGRVVEAIFNLPARVKQLVQAISMTSPTSLQNRQVKRENAIGMFNLIVQLYEKLLPLAQVMAPEHLGEIVRGMVSSARRFMEDVLETFEVNDPEEILEGIAVFERLLPTPENLGGMDAFAQRAETDQIIASISRVETLLREAERGQNGNNGISPGDQRPRRTAPPEGTSGGSLPGSLFGGESNFNRR
jgi:hypothetical protein